MDYLQSTYVFNTRNSLYDCLIAVGILIAFYLLGKFVAYFAKKKGEKWAEKTKTDLDDQIVHFITTFSTLLGIFGGIYFAKEKLILPPLVDKIFNVFFIAVTIFVVTLAAQRIVLMVIQTSLGSLMRKNDFGKTVYPFFRKLITATLWILAGLIFLSNIGFEVSSLIAGLGIGGLAFALAAQDTLGNFISSLSIFTDQPFKVGDMVKVGDIEGTIKEIGIRSTRIQSYQGETVFVIPNAKIADSTIENVSKRSSVRFDFVLGLVYGTPKKKMEKAVEILKSIFEKNEDVLEGYWVNFYEYGDFSLNIKCRVNINPGKPASYQHALDVREELNFEIMKQFEKEGLEFAFPTQTIELKK